ncbi:hypothetical protein ABFA07_018907 [Porites harrisoni]
MNAIIALCHFCEYHGPSVLFCTQAFHCEAHDLLKGTLHTSPSECGACMKRKFTRFAPDVIPGSSGSAQESWASSRSSQCEACKSLDHTHAGFISIDHEAHVSYYSNRSPEQPELYSVVRQACVRSLSCEVCPGREGPMFFGEESSGYVFTHTFFLKDTQSRGFQRWYSIIAVMKDRIYLVNSWPFLVSNFRELIDELQAKANAVYDIELAESVQKGQHIQPSANGAFPLDTFRRQRGGNKTYRGIADLLRDKDLFATLHQRFSWMLKACGNRITEKLLEGPPKEEPLTDLEVQHDDDEPQESSDTAMLADTEGGGTSGPVFRSLRHILKVLGSHKFHLLAFHVIQGNQVIVRGENRKTVESILNCLKVLIPSGCCSCVPYTTEYKDSYACNFLGLAPAVEIPSHILSSDLFVLVDIVSPQGQPDASVEAMNQQEQRGEMDEFQGYGFVVCGKENTMDPSILQKVEEALENENLSDAVFDQLLICLKEEWMDKVKVIFKFARRSGQTTREEKEKLLQILGAKPEDEIVLKFWMKALNKQYRSHLLTCSSTGSNT